jgi:hypothetical protein
MTFTDTTILAALAALAVPLAIHLLGRRRARLVQLPTMRFAQGAHLASRSWRRLKSVALLAARLAVVALLVLALAGPYLAPGEHTGGQTRESITPAAPPYLAPGEYTGGRTATDVRSHETSPLRVLIIDAAGPETGRLRSADLVAATFAYEAPERNTSTRLEPSRGGSPDPPRGKRGDGAYAAGRETRRATADEVGRDAFGAADVVFWVGPRAPADAAPLAEYLARGGAVVWVPGDAPQPPDPPLAAALGLRPAGVQEMGAGVTIDPGGYASDLVAAFEGGTGGDLGAPVFRRRLVFNDATAAIAFRDGRAAAVEGRVQNGRTLALAAGPGPAWGDLAGRAEFVVLMHSLAEALAPTSEAVRAPSDSAYSAPGKYAGDRTREGAPSATAQVPVTPLAPWLALAFVAALAAESLLAALGARRANLHT